MDQIVDQPPAHLSEHPAIKLYLGTVEGLARGKHAATARERQTDAATVLTDLIRRGDELGLPSLHWSLGYGRNLVGNLFHASLPEAYTRPSALAAYHAWCAVIGIKARIDPSSQYGWEERSREYAPGVDVFIRYEPDHMGETCVRCQDES